MTLSDLTSKTPEELNVMCAELLGARWFNVEDGFGKWRCLTLLEEGAENHPRRGPLPIPLDGIGLWCVPDYTGSWDAIMPEVRKASAEQSMAFIEHLRAVLDIKATGEYAYTWMVLTATAQQLTIALILTLHP